MLSHVETAPPPCLYKSGVHLVTYNLFPYQRHLQQEKLDLHLSHAGLGIHVEIRRRCLYLGQAFCKSFDNLCSKL